MTLSPTSNVTVPPRKRVEWKVEVVPAATLIIDHFLSAIQRELPKNGDFFTIGRGGCENREGNG
jgi:hypothetical protein